MRRPSGELTVKILCGLYDNSIYSVVVALREEARVHKYSTT